MNIAWALSLYTIQYIDGKIYGSSVMGGNILCCDSSGTTRILWENDYADPRKGGVFLSSLHFQDEIYFFPSEEEWIVVFHIRTESIRKMQIPEKQKGEFLYPYLYDGKLYVIGSKTGRVWKIDETIRLVHKGDSRIHSLVGKRSKDQSRYQAFCNREPGEILLYDCERSEWVGKETDGPAGNVFFDGASVWYTLRDSLIRDLPDHKDPKTVLWSEKLSEGASYLLRNEKLFLIMKKTESVFEIDQKTNEVKSVQSRYIIENHIHLSIPLTDEHYLLANLTGFGYFFRQEDSLSVFHVKENTSDELPLFRMDPETQTLLEQYYSESVWKEHPDRVIYEEEDHGIGFLIQSMKYLP